jgi:hypothetical protein
MARHHVSYNHSINFCTMKETFFAASFVKKINLIVLNRFLWLRREIQTLIFLRIFLAVEFFGRQKPPFENIKITKLILIFLFCKTTDGINARQVFVSTN